MSHNKIYLKTATRRMKSYAESRLYGLAEPMATGMVDRTDVCAECMPGTDDQRADRCADARADDSSRPGSERLHGTTTTTAAAPTTSTSTSTPAPSNNDDG